VPASREAPKIKEMFTAEPLQDRKDQVLNSDFLNASLQKRAEDGNLRQLTLPLDLIDCCSNNYLGLADHPLIQQEILEEIKSKPSLLRGSTGSRLLTGNSSQLMEFESYLAQRHGTEAALTFPSGYMANLALASSLAGRNDTIIVDEYIHNSIHEGIKQSFAKKIKFAHNNLASLKQGLEKASGKVFVFIESLYSMDGTLADIEQILSLCEAYNAFLIVDEAHSYGIFGKGLVYQLNLQDRVLATLITFGKAIGAHGAAVLGKAQLGNYLINFSSSFIYSTAVPQIQWLSVRKSLDFLDRNPQLSETLKSNIALFKQLVPMAQGDFRSPIQLIHISGNQEVKQIALQLQEQGYYCLPILSPTVAAGKERIRICIHAQHSLSDIHNLASIIQMLYPAI